MNKEIKEKIAEFKTKEANLLISMATNPAKAEAFRVGLLKLRHERTSWLKGLAGYKPDMRVEDGSKIEEMARIAAGEISRSAKTHAQLVEFLETARKSSNMTMRDHERIVDDYSQLEWIAEESAADKIDELIKFGKKVNGKSFLSVLMCKFKKSKSQPTEQKGSSDIEKQK